MRHSLSPVLHNAAFRAAGLDWVYVALHVGAGQGAGAVEAMRVMRIGGLSVTMPHKAAVAAAVDRLDTAAASLGAVNTVWWDGDQLVGSNTDGAGFVQALAVDAGFETRNTRCVVIGSGGAARSVVVALARAGAERIVVVARSAAGAAQTAALAGDIGRVGDRSDVGDADLVVNATPAGMHGTDLEHELPLGIGAGHLHPAQLVADLVYAPPETPFMRAARDRGAVAVNGIGMLVHQAARQFELWTKVDAPVAVMRDAAAAVLAAR